MSGEYSDVFSGDRDREENSLYIQLTIGHERENSRNSGRDDDDLILSVYDLMIKT